MTGRVLVFVHHADGGPDAFGDLLREAGFQLVELTFGGGDAIPELDGFDALVVLGGEMNVWQEDCYPWLVSEKAAIRTWVAGRPRPLLGICLGHQLIADALGGEVGTRDGFEAGIRPVHLTAQAADDPLLGPLGRTFAALQWHGAEVRRVPDGAVVLATNDASAVQAMRVGPAAWGVQFHPEVGLQRAGVWAADPTFRSLLDSYGGPGVADRFPGALEAAAKAMAATTSTLADAFVGQLAGRLNRAG